MKTKMMKAIVATGYGTSEVLKLSKVARPEPKENEVLVKIHAASATTADSMMLTGKPWIGRMATGLLKPKHPIPGTGFAGVVKEVGSQVKLFNIGDRVFGETTLGFSTNAEFVAVPENGVILPMPDNLQFAEAAAFCDGPLTSYNFLKEMAQIKPRQKVLINGAAGSLGTAAIQLARYFGAEVTGVCSTRNTGMVNSIGADHVVDYTRKDFTSGEKNYDIIFDTVGKSSFSKAKKALKSNGLYISPVLKFSLILQMIRTSVSEKKKAKFGASGLLPDNKLREMLAEVLEIWKDGRLKIVIDRQFPLEKVAEAHRYIAAGHKKGNVIITIQL